VAWIVERRRRGKRRGAADGRRSGRFGHPLGDAWARDAVSYPESGESVGLRKAPHDDDSLVVDRALQERCVIVARGHVVVIRLVDHQQSRGRQGAEECLDIGAPGERAGRIVRIAQVDQGRRVVTRAKHRRQIVRPVRRERHATDRSPRTMTPAGDHLARRVRDDQALVWIEVAAGQRAQQVAGTGTEHDALGGHAVPGRQFLPQPGKNGNGMFIYDQRTYLPALLQRQDRMSMAAGLEAREPFLDHVLVQWANALSPGAKLYNGETKGLLKQIAGKWLSQEIITRKKVGFEVPLRVWLRPGGILYARVQAIRKKGSIVQDITADGAVDELIKQHENDEHDHSDTLWTLLALDTWARTFLTSELRTERLPGADTGKQLPQPQETV